MKIIDLLNMISKGEDVPKMIKYDGNIYYKKRNVYKNTNYYESEYNNLLITDIQNSNQLNDLVEIIGEKKLPEKLEEIGKIDYNLEYIDYKDIEVLKTWLNSDMQSIFNELDLIVKNQNQLIDYLESKEEGE